MRRIYLDYASITPIDKRVIREMRRFSGSHFANPSSWYKEGVSAKKALDRARKGVADFIHAHSDEIVFTSGGTESNGLALEGVGRAARDSGIQTPHLIISAIEHSSIMEVANMMEKRGCRVTRLAVDANGAVSALELEKALTPDTYMVSVMAVNNETGSAQPLREIAKAIRNFKKKKGDGLDSAYPLFHTDAAQAALYDDLYVEKLGVDLMTLDGGKMYGPRGIGALYVKRGTPIQPIIIGGGQESGLRSGTENIPAIVGFAKAVEIAEIEKSKGAREKISALRERFISRLKEIDPKIHVNGGEASSPHILNVSIPGIDSEFFVLQLDAKGIACSTKSSCLRDQDESYVLKAIGADSRQSVRFSFGRWTTKRQISRALKIVRSILQKA